MAASTVGALVTGCTVDEVVQASVRIGSEPVEFRVILARTAEQQRDGLSGRESLDAGTGMLFQFGSRSVQQVWMAGATIALDIAWIADGTVLAVDTLPPCTQPDQDRCPRWTSPAPADALLEVPADSLGTVVAGMAVTLEEEAR